MAARTIENFQISSVLAKAFLYLTVSSWHFSNLAFPKYALNNELQRTDFFLYGVYACDKGQKAIFNYYCIGYPVIFNYHCRMVAKKSNTAGNQESLYNSMIASVHINR